MSFELGPIQKAWIAALRAHPERQGTHTLGSRVSGEDNAPYTACCLGEGGLVAGVCEWQGHKLTEKGHPLVTGALEYSYMVLGLRSSNGQATSGSTSSSLATMNDSGKTWLGIADILESNPEEYFTKSV